jgi:hypothetical protein
MSVRDILFGLRVALLAGVAGLCADCSSSQPADDLPPVSYMCPMLKDAEVLLDHAGKCPKCGMELKPVRVVKAYSCLNNTAFIQAEPGKCPTNGADLVPITASMFWACPATPDKHEMNPGKCPDGGERIKKFEPRLHGDHNPRHGGQLFMADDAWHHLEGTYPSPGFFRVYFYDDWTRPLAPAGFMARLIVKDSAGKELASLPLQGGQIVNAMEGRIPNASLPLIASIKVRFKDSEPEKLFDFAFKDYSKDTAEPGIITSAPEPEKEKAPAAVEDPPAALSPMNVIPVGTFQLEPIPANAREILAELEARNKELSEKVEQRAPLGEYWVPALRAKDLALALLSDHLNEIPSAKRAAAETAARRLIRAAYAIDNFGDLGDFEKILSAHGEFAVAVNELRTACASIK